MPNFLVEPGFSGYTLLSWITLALWLALLAAKAVAFFEALRYRSAAYVSAGKWTRTPWLVITGLSLAFHLITDPLHLLSIAGTIGSLVFLLDVRPALKQVSGRGGRGGASSSGPYGPW